ncbi:MAG: hypothetical protein ACFFFB_08485 [Candidatus Heimdallarchaeota archaeon]
MENESNLPPNLHILSCPFLNSCSLPKSQNVCNFPEYKICPDYQSKLNNLKHASKVLH